MESSKEIKILDDLNINYTDLVNSTLDVFEDCSLVINSSNICLLYTSDAADE